MVKAVSEGGSDTWLGVWPSKLEEDQGALFGAEENRIDQFLSSWAFSSLDTGWFEKIDFFRLFV